VVFFARLSAVLNLGEIAKEVRHMPNRGVKGSYPEIASRRIKSTLLLEKLHRHAVGKEEMSSTQIRAAEILLKKCIPDLRQTELTGMIETAVQHKITLEPHGPDD
jgi:hypothetical protein